MIIDELYNASIYRKLSKRIEKAFAYLDEIMHARPEDGRYEIEGEEIYASISTYTTQPAEGKYLEAHKRYIDIQVLLEGQEIIYWTPLVGLDVKDEYEPEKDIAFFYEKEGIPLKLIPGLFAVFFPGDAHKPGCFCDSSTRVRKVVIKVAI